MQRPKASSNVVPPPPVPQAVPVMGKIIERIPVSPSVITNVLSSSSTTTVVVTSSSSSLSSPSLLSSSDAKNDDNSTKTIGSLHTADTKPLHPGGFPEVFHRHTGLSSLPIPIASSTTENSTKTKRPSLFRQRMNALQTSTDSNSNIPGTNPSFTSSFYRAPPSTTVLPSLASFATPLPRQSTSLSLPGPDDDTSLSIENMSNDERKAALAEVFSFLSPDTIAKWITMRSTNETTLTKEKNNNEKYITDDIHDKDTVVPSSLSSINPALILQPSSSVSSSYNPLALDLSGITDEDSLRQAVNTLLPESEKAKLRWTGMVDDDNNNKDQDKQLRKDKKKQGNVSSKFVQFLNSRNDNFSFTTTDKENSDTNDNEEDEDDDEEDEDAVYLPNVTLPMQTIAPDSTSEPSYSSSISSSQENIYNKAGTAHLLSLWAKAVEDSEEFSASQQRAHSHDETADVSVDPGAERMMEDLNDDSSSMKKTNNDHIDILSTETINTRLSEIRKNLGLENKFHRTKSNDNNVHKSNASALPKEHDGIKLMAHSSLYKLRFDLKGLLIKPSWKDSYTTTDETGVNNAMSAHQVNVLNDGEDSSVLYHHGTNPTEAGYTVIDLLGLTRSSIDSQRIMAWKCLTGILLRRRAAFVYPFDTCPGCTTATTNNGEDQNSRTRIFPQTTSLHDYLFGNSLGCCCGNSSAVSLRNNRTSGNKQQQQYHSRWNYTPTEWSEEAQRLRTLLLPPILPVLIRSGLDEKKPSNIIPVFQTLFAWCIPVDSMIEGYTFPSSVHELFNTEELPAPLIRPQPPTMDEDDWAWLVTRRLPYTYNSNNGTHSNDTDTAMNTGTNTTGTTNVSGMNRNAATALNDGRTALRDPLLTLCMRMEILERIARIIEGILQRTSNGIVELGMTSQPLLTTLSSTDLTLFIQCIHFLRAAVGRDISIGNYVARNLALTIDIQRTVRKPTSINSNSTNSKVTETYTPIRRKVRVGLLRFLVYYCTNNITINFAAPTVTSTTANNTNYYLATIGTVSIIRILCQHGIDLTRSLIDNDNTETLDSEIPYGSGSSSLSTSSSSSTINLPPIRIEDILRFIPVLQSQCTDLVHLSTTASSSPVSMVVRLALELSYETLRLYRICLYYGLGTSYLRGFFTQWFPHYFGTFPEAPTDNPVSPLVVFQTGYLDCVRLTILATVKELQQFDMHTATNIQRDDVFSAVTQVYSMVQAIMTVLGINGGGAENNGTPTSILFFPSLASLVLRSAVYRIFEAYISITRTSSSGLNFSNRNYAVNKDDGNNLPTLLDLVSNHPVALTTLTEEVLVPLLRQEWSTKTVPDPFTLNELFLNPFASTVSYRNEYHDNLFLSWASLSLLIHERIPFVSEQKLWKIPVFILNSSESGTYTTIDRYFESVLPTYLARALALLGKYLKPVPNYLPLEVTSLSVHYIGNIQRIRNQYYSLIGGLNLFTHCLSVSSTTTKVLQQVLVHLLSMGTNGDEGLVWVLLSDTLFRILGIASLPDELLIKRTLLPLWRDNILGTGNIFLIYKRIILSLLRTHHSYPGLVTNVHSIIQNLQAHSLTTGDNVNFSNSSTTVLDSSLPQPSYSQYMNPYVQSTASKSLLSILKHPWSCNLGNILYLNTAHTNPHRWTNPSDYLSQLLTVITSPFRTPLGLPLYTESLVTVPFAIGMFMSGITDSLLGEASAQVQADSTQEIHDILRYENNDQTNTSNQNNARWIQLCETAMVLMKTYPYIMESKHYDNISIDTMETMSSNGIISIRQSSFPNISSLVIPLVRYGRTVHFLLHAGLVPMKDTLVEELVPFLLSQMYEFQNVNNTLYQLLGTSIPSNKFVTLLEIIIQYPGMGMEAMNTLSKALITKIGSEGSSTPTTLAIVCVCILLMHGTFSAYITDPTALQKNKPEQENINLEFRRSLYRTLVESSIVCLWKIDEKYFSSLLPSSSTGVVSPTVGTLENIGADKEYDIDCLQEGSILIATDYRSMVQIYTSLSTGQLLSTPNKSLGIKMASPSVIQQRFQLLKDSELILPSGISVKDCLTISEYYCSQQSKEEVYFPAPLTRNSIGGFILYSLGKYLWTILPADTRETTQRTKLSFHRVELLRRMIATELTQVAHHIMMDNEKECILPVLSSVVSLLLLAE